MNFKLSITALFAILLFAAFSENQEPISTEKTFTVVELFTSQGCHSCPPADRLLTKLLAESESSKTEIIPLSFHVDYWNYLGWKDPYSSPEFSKRQRRYADALGSGVYTPQMVFNGTFEAIGSKEADVRKRLKSVKKAAKVDLKFKVDFDPDGNFVTVDYSVGSLLNKAVLNIAVVERGIEDSVKRGENRGKILKHDNVVREFRTYDLKTNPADLSMNSSIAVCKIPEEVKVENASVVVFVQKKVTLEILTVGKVDLF